MRAMRTVLWLLVAAAVSGLGADHSYPVQLSSRSGVSSQAELAERMDAAFGEGIAHPTGINNCSGLLAKGRETVFAKATGPDAQAQKSTLANRLVFRELRNAAGAQWSHLSELKWDENVMPLLPPQLAINVS